MRTDKVQPRGRGCQSSELFGTAFRRPTFSSLFTTFQITPVLPLYPRLIQRTERIRSTTNACCLTEAQSQRSLRFLAVGCSHAIGSICGVLHAPSTFIPAVSCGDRHDGGYNESCNSTAAGEKTLGTLPRFLTSSLPFLHLASPPQQLCVWSFDRPSTGPQWPKESEHRSRTRSLQRTSSMSLPAMPNMLRLPRWRSSTSYGERRRLRKSSIYSSVRKPKRVEIDHAYQHGDRRL